MPNLSSETLIRAAEEMSRLPELKAAAITGGEPFAEFELLNSLVYLFNKADKRVVIYTSGYWGKPKDLRKAELVLQLVDGLVLGVDLYHRAYIPDEDLINALRAARESGVWITAQVIRGVDGGAHLAYAHELLEKAYGSEWENQATIEEMPPLPSGRAEQIQSFDLVRGAFGERCFSINGPTLLRNGTLAACCNEDIVLHKGPDQLRVQDQGGLRQSLEALERQPIVRYLQEIPPSILLSLAAQSLESDLGDQPRRMCQACWDFIELYSQMNASQRERFEKLANAYYEITSRPFDGELSNSHLDKSKQVSHV